MLNDNLNYYRLRFRFGLFNQKVYVNGETTEEMRDVF